MGYLFKIILKYENGFLTKIIRFFDKNFERLQKHILFADFIICWERIFTKTLQSDNIIIKDNLIIK